MMYYMMASSTAMLRTKEKVCYPLGRPPINGLDAWEPIISTKRVWYAENEKVQYTEPWYYFRLPESANPYAFICVNKEYVVDVNVPNGQMFLGHSTIFGGSVISASVAYSLT